jgi:predicted HAD superfamily Cof-like phosphohydrolase
MSDSWFLDVYEFHRAFCPEQIGEQPRLLDRATAKLRVDLLDEELGETLTAIDAGYLAGIADGLVDLIYVAIGTAIAFGIDLRPVWDAVHAANLRKAGGPRRVDGKALKPPGWQPPDIKAILTAQPPLAPPGPIGEARP